MLTSVSTLYMPGQVIDRSVYQGSTYLGEHFDNPLTFDTAYTMPTPTTEAINPPTVPASIVGNNLFMGRADGYWIYKIYNHNNLVKTMQMVNQEFAIPVQHDKIESITMPFGGTDPVTCGHGHDCPSPAGAALIMIASAFAYGRKRNK